MRWISAAGVSLIETLIAVALLAGLAAGLAHVVVLAQRAIALGSADAAATLAAVQKLEELRSLDWTFEPRTGRRRTDTTTDLSQGIPTAPGAGLRASPAGAMTLEASVPGYVDYLDARGAWIGTGPEPVPGTVYVRQWAVGTLASNEDVLVLQVAVIDRRMVAEPSRAIRPDDPGVTWLATLRTRR